MISFKEFLNENSLNEAISKEFKDVAGPLILKEFGDYMNLRGLSVQNANFIKLSDSEKSALKRRLSEKKLDELPFGQQYIVFVRPFDKQFYKDFMDARKNPDPENEFSRDWRKHGSNCLGDMTILDRSDGTFHHIWMTYYTPTDFKDGKWIHKAPKASSRVENIYQGVTAEFKTLIDDRTTIAFTFDTKEADTWKLRQQRDENKRTNDLLDPNKGSYNSSNPLDDLRRAKLNKIKNSKTATIYVDKIKKIGYNLINELKGNLDKFFEDLNSNPKHYKYDEVFKYGLRDKLDNYSDLLYLLETAIKNSGYRDRTQEIEKYLSKFK